MRAYTAGEIPLDAVRLHLADVRAQPEQCLDASGPIARLAMGLSGTLGALDLCLLDRSQADQAFAVLDAYGRDEIGQAAMVQALNTAVVQFNANSSAFAPLVDRTVTLVFWSLLGFLAVKGVIISLVGVLVLRDAGRLLDALAEEKRVLVSANESLEEFTHVASHDLRAPARAVGALAQFIEDELGEMAPEPVRRDLAQLKLRAGRMLQMIDRLLLYSKSTTAGGRLQAVDPQSVIGRVCDALDPRLAGAVRVAGPLPHLVTDPVPFELVVRNLLDNCMRHHDGGVPLRIDICGRRLGDLVEFSIADNGPGIPEAHRQRIFRAFQTLTVLDDGDERARGMGLALVKRTIQRHGGAITVADREPRGAVFHFTWKSPVSTSWEAAA